jgi:phosphoglycerate dehydrogenase-like enzyme
LRCAELPEARTPRVAVAPLGGALLASAIEAGGGVPTAPTDEPNALVWTNFNRVPELKEILGAHRSIEWVQLPVAGVERFFEAGLFDTTRLWTSAKGLYAEPVAEHALALALACLRDLPERVRATSWGTPAATTLYDQPVTIVGGGGIASALIELLLPFRAAVTVARQRQEPLPGALRTVGSDGLSDALASALVVVLALAVTPTTRRLIGADALRVMRPDSVLVNVARGAIVDTDALVAALENQTIGWAALDVTDPEPLPAGHRLWALPNCLITPHTADTLEMTVPLLAKRVTANVRHFGRGEPLEGVVNLELGY